ncbi:MAG: Peptidase protein [Patescibacteria group bacterium]|nr:Peptidase protein [Patescibacteria group bacterium]
MNRAIKIFIWLTIFGLANPTYGFQQDYTPLDPYLFQQSYLGAINAKGSWSYSSKENKEVVVAVLDSGIDLVHPDLKNNIWINSDEIPGDGLDNDENSYIDDINGWDFVDSDNTPTPVLLEGYDYTAVNHGTVIAGIIGASANDEGIIGVNPRVKIMDLRILDAKGMGNTLVLSQAIDYAAENGADIINLSLVGKSIDESLKKSISNAYNKGVMIVAASGNESKSGVDLDIEPAYPVCDFDNINKVIGVAAVDSQNKLSAFSNYGEKCIDISAPGVNVYSTVYHDLADVNFSSYYRGGWSGTSVAAPMVTGALSLLKMNYPNLRPADLYSILLASSDSLQAASPLIYKKLGKGLLNIGAALDAANKYYNQTIKIVLAPQANLTPEILIMNDKGNLLSSFLAYDKKFKGGVNLATGDLDNNGSYEIVTAPLSRGGPHVRVFSNQGSLINEFFAYDGKYTGGVNLAVGDLQGDKSKQIVTAQVTGGSEIKVFKANGSFLKSFVAYDAKFKGGVNIAVGDVDNDGKAEIITAPASNGGPHIKVFNNDGLLLYQFFAYDKKMTKGVWLTVGDLDHDGWQDIVTVPAKNTMPQVRAFNFNGTALYDFIAYSQYLTSGIRLSARDLSGDGLVELLALPNKSASALLRIYDSKGLEKSNVYLRNAQDKNGYNLDILLD